LNTPDEIRNRPEVSNAIQTIQNMGVALNLQTAVDPPYIAGSYSLKGRHLYPDTNQLAPGTWTWTNQTEDNHITTRYEQALQTGASPVGEIIRGSGNRFTVYSVTAITQHSAYGSNCTVPQTVVIVDGTQNTDGSISMRYFIVLLNGQTDCGLNTTIGEMTLTRR